MIKILIDGAGTVTCQSVMKGFYQQDAFEVELITIDSNPENVGAYWSNGFYQVPLANDPGFISELIRIINLEKVDLFIPIIDSGFYKISEYRSVIRDAGAETFISSPFVIETCNDKYKTCGFLKSAGFKTNSVVKSKTYPHFIKPRLDGRASIDCYKVEDDVDFNYTEKHVLDSLRVELLYGEEHTVDTLSDFDGKFIGGVTRKRIETKSGVSYKAKVIHDKEMLAQARDIVEALPIIGPANLQCFRNGKDVFWFEINPRFSGTLAASIGAGFNSPYLLLKLLSGKKITQKDIKYENVTMLRYWDEIILDKDSKIKSASLKPFFAVL